MVDSISQEPRPQRTWKAFFPRTPCLWADRERYGVSRAYILCIFSIACSIVPIFWCLQKYSSPKVDTNVAHRHLFCFFQANKVAPSGRLALPSGQKSWGSLSAGQLNTWQLYVSLTVPDVPSDTSASLCLTYHLTPRQNIFIYNTIKKFFLHLYYKVMIRKFFISIQGHWYIY